ncbi:hypothetical protein [Agrococcus sp. KRD186]|uniref:hypothetical protein n=1 Tax=Agrococcus sp. KRD186 TaxID=2729730 RepID=UPI0019D2C0A2|nr:hypothetical protein [Agrococcus sp. KRD186]
MAERPESGDPSAAVGGAPPPPGADSPVPADAAARAAAAGRAKRMPAPSAPRADALVPTTAIENRAQDRARARRARLGLGGQEHEQAVANPGAGMPGQLMPPGLMPAVAESMPQRLVPTGWQQPAAHRQHVQPMGPYPGPPPRPAPYAANPSAVAPYGPAPGAAPAQPRAIYEQLYPGLPYPGTVGTSPIVAYPAGAAPAYASGPYPYMQPVAYAPGSYAPMLPPRVAWSRRQRSAALLSSWLGQTLMALATHLLTAFTLIVTFAFLLHVSGDSMSDFEADSFTSVIARWTMPDRVWATAVIGALVGGGLLAAGWLLHALWARSAGLAKPHRSAWLAWLCTTATTGLIGMVVWPFALIGGFIVVLTGADASLTTGTMWEVLFWELGLAVLLTGGVGLLFGWLFLSQARPRVDYRAVAEAEEAAARARDEAELTAVQLRGEPSSADPWGRDPR